MLNAIVNTFLAPVFGPTGPLYNSLLWGGLVESVRRQYNQAYANSTPTLNLQTTGQQDADDRQIHGTLGGFDPDGDALAYSVPTTGPGAPAHGEVTINAVAGTWTYTPDAGYSGADSFTISASDAAGFFHIHRLGHTHSTTDSITVTVGAAATGPQIISGPSGGAGGDVQIVTTTDGTRALTQTRTYDEATGGAYTTTLTLVDLETGA